MCISASAVANVADWDRLSTPSFTHLTIDRDLPNIVTGIAQDVSGLIWIGTQGGLVQWDGYRSRTFLHDPHNPHSLPSDFINKLAVSPRGTLFVSTNDQVSRYDALGDEFQRLPLPIAGSFEPMAVDEADGVWIGNGEGLWHLPAGAGTWDHIDLGGAKQVRRILVAREGTIWVATDRSLLRKVDAAAGSFATVDGLPQAARISSLAESRDGRLWIGTSTGLLYVIEGTQPARPVTMPATGNSLISMAEWKHGLMIVGTLNQGMIYINSATLTVERSVHADELRPDGLSSGSIETLMADRDDGLWVGHDRGVDYSPGLSGAFQTIMPSAGERPVITGRNATAVLAVDDRHVWVGSEGGGADLIDPTTGRVSSVARQPANAHDSLPNVWVGCLAMTATGLWVGTGHGLFEVRGTHVTRFPALGEDPVYALVTDGDALWVGLRSKGLVRLDLQARTIKAYRHALGDNHSLSDDSVQALLLDLPHGLWVGTSHGLSFLDTQTEKFQRFSHLEADDESLPSDHIDSLLFDSLHRLWVGTLGGGLAVALHTDNGRLRFKTLARRDGLPDSNVDKLVSDLEGRVWASTDRGIAVIDPSSLHIRSFDQSDGVSLHGHWANSGARMPDGTILFGGYGGVTIVQSSRIADATMAPAPLITSLQSPSRRMSPQSVVTLNSPDPSLQIEFASLSYAESHKLQYAYRLGGFDDHWIPADSDHRLAVYSNLSPGTYQFMVKASKGASQWSPVKTLLIHVVPRWYQTFWWEGVVGLMASLGVVGIVRMRTALLVRQRVALESCVTERTRELSAVTQALERLASQDVLTGIANRRRFEDVLDQEIRRSHRSGEPLALLLIDVDDFKSYNDSYGHQAGDEVLRQVALLCQIPLRRVTDLAARYGGEEFAVLLPGVGLSGALSVANSIVAEVANARIRHDSARAAAYVTISVGVSATDALENPSERELIGSADAALYTAKELGRNQAVAARPATNGGRTDLAPLDDPSAV